DETGRYWEIAETPTHQKMARKGGLVTVELVEIPSGKKQVKKLKSNVDEMDVVEAPMIDFLVERIVDQNGDTVYDLPPGSNGIGLGLVLEGVEAQYEQTVRVPVDRFLGSEPWHDLRFLMAEMDLGDDDDGD